MRVTVLGLCNVGGLCVLSLLSLSPKTEQAILGTITERDYKSLEQFTVIFQYSEIKTNRMFTPSYDQLFT